MTRVGLVLGAGGNVGQAYHAGVLAALEQDLGWDPRTSEVTVGTSAGSVVASLVCLGAPAADVAAHFLGEPLSLDGAAILEPLRQIGHELPPLSLSSIFKGPWHGPSLRLVRRAALRPWAVRADRVVMTLLPDGKIDLFEHAADALASPVLSGEWPPGLRICAARCDDARRVVFGSPGAPRATLSEAIAASCAIPGFFTPVTIGGVRYFDGGVHSPTNADILRRSGLDLVIVSSPMSSANGRLRTPSTQLRRDAHLRLKREVAALRRAGTTVICFEPAHQSMEAMGTDALDTTRSADIVKAAFLEARGWAADRRTAPLLKSVTRHPRADNLR